MVRGLEREDRVFPRRIDTAEVTLQRARKAVTDFRGYGSQWVLSAVGDLAGYGARILARTAGISSTLGLLATKIVADEAATSSITAGYRVADGPLWQRFGYEMIEGLSAQAFMYGALKSFAPGFRFKGISGFFFQGAFLALASLTGEGVAHMAGSQMPLVSFNSPDAFLARVLDTFIVTARGRTMKKIQLDRPMEDLEGRCVRLGYQWQQWKVEGLYYPDFAQKIPQIIHAPDSIHGELKKDVSTLASLLVHDLPVSSQERRRLEDLVAGYLAAAARVEPKFIEWLGPKAMMGSALLCGPDLLGRNVMPPEEYILCVLQDQMLMFNRWGYSDLEGPLDDYAVSVDSKEHFCVQVIPGVHDGRGGFEYRLLYNGPYYFEGWAGRNRYDDGGIVLERLSVSRRVGGWVIHHNQGGLLLKQMKVREARTLYDARRRVVGIREEERDLLYYAAQHPALGQGRGLRRWLAEHVITELRRGDPSATFWWLRGEYRQSWHHASHSTAIRGREWASPLQMRRALRRDIVPKFLDFSLQRGQELLGLRKRSGDVRSFVFGSPAEKARESLQLRTRAYQRMDELHHMAGKLGFKVEYRDSPWFILRPPV